MKLTQANKNLIERLANDSWDQFAASDVGMTAPTVKKFEKMGIISRAPFTRIVGNKSVTLWDFNQSVAYGLYHNG